MNPANHVMVKRRSDLPDLLSRYPFSIDIEFVLTYHIGLLPGSPKGIVHTNHYSHRNLKSQPKKKESTELLLSIRVQSNLAMTAVLRDWRRRNIVFGDNLITRIAGSSVIGSLVLSTTFAETGDHGKHR
jgi:hypothetical protein